MSFKDQKTKDIIVDHEDDEWIYMKQPIRIRVNKVTYKLQKLNSRLEWVEPHFTLAGSKKHTYPAVSINGEIWSVQRIIGTLFCPNPEGFKFIHVEDPFDPTKMRWVKNLSLNEENNDFTSIKDRKKALEGLTTKSKEYFRAYNRLKGQDGLTNTQRYVARKRALGLVLVPKKYSPTGRQVWVSHNLKVSIMVCNENGFIKDEGVRAKLIEMVMADEEAHGTRINKPYKK